MLPLLVRSQRSRSPALRRAFHFVYVRIAVGGNLTPCIHNLKSLDRRCTTSCRYGSRNAVEQLRVARRAKSSNGASTIALFRHKSQKCMLEGAAKIRVGRTKERLEHKTSLHASSRKSMCKGNFTAKILITKKRRTLGAAPGVVAASSGEAEEHRKFPGRSRGVGRRTPDIYTETPIASTAT